MAAMAPIAEPCTTESESVMSAETSAGRLEGSAINVKSLQLHSTTSDLIASDHRLTQSRDGCMPDGAKAVSKAQT